MNKNLFVITIIIIVFFGNINCLTLAQNIAIENTVSENGTTENIQDENTNTLVINSIEQLQNLHEETQNQIKEANEQLENISIEMTESLQQIQELNEQIESYEVEIEQLKDEANKLKNSIDKLEKELVISQEKYEFQKGSLEKRLSILYELGETRYLDVLLQSRSIGDFISRYYLISQLAEYDNEILEDIEIEKTKIETAKSNLEQERKLYKVAKDNAERTSIILENTRVVKNNYMNQLTEEEKILQEKIDIYNEQMKRIDAEIRLYALANVGTDYVGGDMSWPVPGYSRISSPFGMRVHPITGIYKLHTGTDISAPMGANFVASNSGIVIKAEYNTAYGNMVVIDHGGGVVSLYAHGSEIMVNIGDKVNKGDVVLKVGDTGYSTGPHAHFEIRINGEYKDPMQILNVDKDYVENTITVEDTLTIENILTVKN